MRKSAIAAATKEPPILDRDDPRLPPYAKLTEENFRPQVAHLSLAQWDEREEQVRLAAVEWTKWKLSQRRDFHQPEPEGETEFELVSPLGTELSAKQKAHQKDLRRIGNMA